MIDRVGLDDGDGPSNDLDRLALRALEGRSTLEETARLDALCAASPEALEQVRALGDVWMLSAVARMGSGRLSVAKMPVRKDRRWTMAAAAGLVAVLGLGLWLGIPTRSVVYEAPADAMRTVKLSDGSILSLSRGGRVEVSIDGDRREVRQRVGEAYYDVVQDPDRPFVVASAGHRLTVLGTRFNVAPDPTGLRVDLLEGRLHIESQDVDLVLRPGQVFRQSETPKVAAADVEASSAWTQGRLIFDDVTLAEVAARVQRHTGREISLASSGASELRFSGVLSIDRPDEWAVALASVLPVTTRRTHDGITVALIDD